MFSNYDVSSPSTTTGGIRHAKLHRERRFECWRRKIRESFPQAWSKKKTIATESNHYPDHTPSFNRLKPWGFKHHNQIFDVINEKKFNYNTGSLWAFGPLKLAMGTGLVLLKQRFFLLRVFLLFFFCVILLLTIS